MLLVVFIAAAAAFAAQCAAGQFTAPSCTDPAYAWASNSLGQNPCMVSAFLEAVCSSDGGFSIPALGFGQHYTGPNGASTDPADATDLCKCNTVVYSTISACAACQGSGWLQWSIWSRNCTSYAPDGIYPKGIPSGTRVPHWAYLSVFQTDLWNNASALQASRASSSESSAPTSSTLTVLGSLSTTTSAASPSAVPSSARESSLLRAGVLVNSAVALVAVALAARLTTWF